MTRTIYQRVRSATFVAMGCLLGSMVAHPCCLAEEKPTDQAASASAGTSENDGANNKSDETSEKSAPQKAPKKRQFRGRLPAYFGEVVDEKQRQHIYDIQLEYHPRIQVLKSQLKALLAERDAEIRDVITDAQWEKIEQLRREAKQKRPAQPKTKP